MSDPLPSLSDDNNPSWLYNEMRQVGLDFEDAGAVAAYDCLQGTDMGSMRTLVARLGLGPGQRCVEFGCGTGAFAVAAAKTGARIDAVDVSRAMLAAARHRAAEQELKDAHFHYAGFLTYRHEGPRADVVVSQYALHHLPDFWKMPALLNIAAMLKSGGLFYLEDVVFSFAPADYDTQIEAWFQRVAKPTGEGFTRDDFATHVRDEHSTFSWVLEGMLERSGFSIETSDTSDPAYGHYFCRKN